MTTPRAQRRSNGEGGISQRPNGAWEAGADAFGAVNADRAEASAALWKELPKTFDEEDSHGETQG